MTSAAEYHAHSDEITLTCGQYACRFHRAQLGYWIAFYKRLRDRKGGRYRRFYVDDVRALERVRREIEALS
ncbi:MAG: hypothetical protein AAFQ38_15020 [Pseudomonadota bacterium]